MISHPMIIELNELHQGKKINKKFYSTNFLCHSQVNMNNTQLFSSRTDNKEKSLGITEGFHGWVDAIFTL